MLAYRLLDVCIVLYVYIYIYIYVKRKTVTCNALTILRQLVAQIYIYASPNGFVCCDVMLILLIMYILHVYYMYIFYVYIACLLLYLFLYRRYRYLNMCHRQESIVFKPVMSSTIKGVWFHFLKIVGRG